MQRKIFILVFIAAFLISCQTGKEEAKKFSDDFVQIVNKLKEKKEKVNTRDEYVAYQEEEKREFETLFKKYEESPSIEEIEILRSRVLLRLKKLADAQNKIDKVLAKNPDLINEAKMVKVEILIEREQFVEACNIFKEIEAEIKDLNDLFNAYFNLALKHGDSKIREEYSKKFLAAKDIPEEYSKNRYIMYSNLAAVATLEGDLDKARNILKDAIAETKDDRQKVSLEKQLGQLDFIGKKIFSLTANTWINSYPVALENMKGKVVILSFWAPWCTHCRTMTPILVEEYEKNKDKGLMIIGLTRFYGKYEDDLQDKGEVNKDEELELIKQYLERKKMDYPVVIANEMTDYDNYKIIGLPTMVFIDKKGTFDFIQTGSTDRRIITDKIQRLLAE